MADAVQDLVFLGKRLKGLIELSDTLTTKESLENSIQEFKGTLESLKSLKEDKEKEINKLQDYIVETSNALEEHLQEGKVIYQNLLDKANKDSSEIINKAKEEASSIINKANSSLSSVEDSIKERKNFLVSIEDNIISKNITLNKILKDLENLKNKF